MIILITYKLKAIFLHSPDQEFAPIGAKSEIPYEKWFQQFKQFLMKNSTSPDITNLFMFWNGRVFSFDTAQKSAGSNGEESSGMDEAELGLNAINSGDSEIENLLPTNRQEPTENPGGEAVNGEEFVDGFSNLTLALGADSTEIDTNFIVISAACRSFISHGPWPLT
jgi:hypothetical protein